ncbi:MAG: hydroxylamine oxidase, partial [Deltaproteobacteria bacterium]|nr:hydroxylamine oxidase [Deltaproteobacteria bacterium]
MKNLVFALLMVFASTGGAFGASLTFSEATEECISCHASVSPGIVGSWKKSRHAKISPAEALKKPKLERRISAERVPDNLAQTVVGCAECHTLNPEKHKDTFEHEGYQVHIVVTPEDCAVCHPTEAKQYAQNLMSHAYGNLKNNPLYHNLADSVNGIQSFEDMKTTLRPPDPETNF